MANYCSNTFPSPYWRLFFITLLETNPNGLFITDVSVPILGIMFLSMPCIRLRYLSLTAFRPHTGDYFFIEEELKGEIK